MKKISYTLFCVIILLIILSGTSFSEKSNLSEKKKELIRDNLLFNSAQGREFWVAFPPNEDDGQPLGNTEEWALEIYVTASKKTTATIECQGLNIRKTKNVDPLKITVFSSLTEDINWGLEIRSYEKIEPWGVHVTSPQPISVYCMNARHVTSDGYLAIPTSAWGTDYIHLSYYDFFENLAGGDGERRGGGFIIVAGYNDTKVRIELKGKGGAYATTYTGYKIGDQINRTLNAGEILFIRGDGKTRGVFDLSGSRVTGNKPFGFISSHMRTLIPSYDLWNGRDYMVEMIPPVTAWGKKYSTVEFQRKGNGDFFRIIASQPNTKFSVKWYDLNTKNLIEQRSGTLKSASDFAEFEEIYVPQNQQNTYKSIRGTSVWTADKPVLVMQYSYSTDWDGAPEFDPFMILVVPEEQYIPATVFQTPATPGATFVDNYFNIVAIGDSTDLSGSLLRSITLDDKPIYVIEPGFPFNRIPTTNLYWAKVRVEKGAHVVKGNTKFGGYIYGFDYANSYGWPAAMAINKLDETDTLEPVLYLTEDCGDYIIRATEFRNGGPNDDPRQVDQGVADVQLLEESYNYIIEQPVVLIPYPPVYDYSFNLKVINKFKPGFALFAVTDRAGNTAIDSVRYEPDSLKLDPDALVFGQVRVRTTKTMNADLINISDSTILIKSIKLQTNSVFKLQNPVPPPDSLLLLSGEKYTIKVNYTPTEEMENDKDFDIDSILVETECLEYKWPVSGQGILPRIKVEDWDAGAVKKNTTVCKKAQTGRGLRIWNEGTMTLTITEIIGVTSPFTLSVPPQPPLPIIIEPKGEVFLNECCFTPPDANSYSIDVLFKSDADPVGSDSISNWKGRGIDAGAYITDVDWGKKRVETINDSVVYIRSVGNTKLKITDVNLSTNDPNFSIDKANIKPGLPNDLYPEDWPDSNVIKEIVVPVRYVPKTEANHQVFVVPTFDDPNIKIQGTLKGIGILPKIQVIGDYFKPPILVNTKHPNTGYVTIKSTSTSADLYIDRIQWKNDPSLNTADFKEINPFPSKFVVPMGDSVKLPVEFTPSNIGHRRAVAQVWSDAVKGPEPITYVMTQDSVLGDAYDVGIVVDSIHFGNVLFCDEPILKFKITNTAFSAPVTINQYEWVEGDQNVFEIIGPNPVFDIKANSSQVVEVRFKPYKFRLNEPETRPFRAVLKVYSSAGDENYVLIDGTGYDVLVTLSQPAITDMQPGFRTVSPPYKDYPLSISSTNWKDADIKEFRIEVAYKTGWMKWAGSAQVDDIFKGNILPADWTLKGNEIVGSDTTMLVITGKGTTPIMQDGIFARPVWTLLLTDTIETTIKPWYGKISFMDRDECVIAKSTGGSISTSTCVRDLRSVFIEKTAAELYEVIPNPVGDNGFELEYSIGLSGNTTIEIFNSNSDLVKTIVNEYTEPGHYSKKIETKGMNSGVYFIRMKSAGITDVKRLIISK